MRLSLQNPQSSASHLLNAEKVAMAASMSGWKLTSMVTARVGESADVRPEAVSVILQVSYFKITGGKRLFRMAPLHHHFELIGWSETHVTQRFWLVSVLAAMIGVALALV